MEFSLRLRDEESQDWAAIRIVNEDAFGRPDEADLIDKLREEGAVLASFVAEFNGRVVGHILFSRMTAETEQGPVQAVALAPMAVLREYQGRQIGSHLVGHGLTQLRALGEQIVIVLGHADYYPRLGFSPERARHLMSPFPPEAYMALELEEGALAGVRGRVRYPTSFGLDSVG